MGRVLSLVCSALLVVALSRCSVEASSSSEEFYDRFYILRNIFGGIPHAVNTSHATPQPLMVIGAGIARTGTASFMTALQRLGLKSYHMKALGTTDNLDIWAEHARQRLAGQPGIADKILDHLAAEGYTATADDPGCLLYKEMMERYPQARVVLTVRTHDDDKLDAWADSMMNTVTQIHGFLARTPWRWIPRSHLLAAVTKWVRHAQGAVKLAETHVADREELIQSYKQWKANVIATVPPDRLLIFAPTDGWKPLCDFLAPLNATSVQQACEEILETGEAYPRVNDSKVVFATIRFFLFLTYAFHLSPFWILGCVMLFLRKRKQSQISSQSVKDKQA